jgi:hypothetical protein
MATILVQHASHVRLPRWSGVVALVALAALAWALSFGGHRAVEDGHAPVVNPVVRWQDSRHDWLLVADRATHELVVYDAMSGAPLERLGDDDGLGQVDSIARFGDRLLVRDLQGDTRMLALPGLHAATIAAR